MSILFTDIWQYLSKTVLHWWGWIFAAVCTALVAWWDASPETLRMAVIGGGILVLADTILGIARAWVSSGRQMCSAGFGKVLVKLTVYMGSLLAAYGIDIALGLQFSAEVAIALLICIREATSVMENSAALGFTWPSFISTRVLKMNETIDGKEIDDDDD